MDRRGHQTFLKRYGHERREGQAELRAANVKPKQNEAKAEPNKDSVYDSKQPTQQTGRNPVQSQHFQAKSSSILEPPVTPISKRTRGLEDPFYAQESRLSKSPRKDETPRSAAGVSPAQFKLLSMSGGQDQTPGTFSTNSKQTAATEANKLTEDITIVLDKHGIILPDKAREDMVSLAAKYAMKMQGIVKGRDIVRTELQKRNAEQQKLMAKIRELEASLEMHKVSSEILIKRAKELEHMKTHENAEPTS